MTVCFANGLQYDTLVEVLHQRNYLRYVTGLQRIDFNRRYALVFNNYEVRDHLVQHGLDINGIHITFGYHKRRTPLRIRVFITELPIGITNEEIANVLEQYGSILNIASIDKVLYGRKIDTGDRVVTFSSINVAIPSYVSLRGRRSFVRYRGQVSTCRICGDSSHIAKDCPKNRKNAKPDEPMNSQQKPENPFESESEVDNQSSGVMEIMDAPADVPEPESTEKLHIPEPEPVILTGTSIIQETHTDLSVAEDIQSESVQSKMNSCSTEVREDRQVTDKSCCPQSLMDSHSDAECPAALPKQTIKRNSDAGNSKQGVSAVGGKRKEEKGGRRFKHDLQQVVIKEKCTAEL